MHIVSYSTEVSTLLDDSWLVLMNEQQHEADSVHLKSLTKQHCYKLVRKLALDQT